MASFRSWVGRAAKLLTVDLRGKQGISRREGWNLARDPAVGTNAGCVCVRSGAVAAAEKVAAPTSATKRRRK